MSMNNFAWLTQEDVEKGLCDIPYVLSVFSLTHTYPDDLPMGKVEIDLEISLWSWFFRKHGIGSDVRMMIAAKCPVGMGIVVNLVPSFNCAKKYQVYPLDSVWH